MPDAAGRCGNRPDAARSIVPRFGRTTSRPHGSGILGILVLRKCVQLNHWLGPTTPSRSSAWPAVSRARNVDELWANLAPASSRSVSSPASELLAAGVARSCWRDAALRAGRRGVLDDVDRFDAGVLRLQPARGRDHGSAASPLPRVRLGGARGRRPRRRERFRGPIGVFAGCGMSALLHVQPVSPIRELVDSVGLFLLRHTGNDKDFLATRVSYCSTSRGPSVSVQTACSTSLVAVHLACQSLLSRRVRHGAGRRRRRSSCRTARGYLYQEGEILSPDGHCRAFDASAQGTVFGSGVGVVVLKRLARRAGRRRPHPRRDQGLGGQQRRRRQGRLHSRRASTARPRPIARRWPSPASIADDDRLRRGPRHRHRRSAIRSRSPR